MTQAEHGFWSKYGLRRVSRRRALAGGAAISIASVALAACGADEPDSTQPQEGGVLRTGTTSPFSGLDPQTEAGTGLAITARLYGYLLHIDPRDEAVIYDQADEVEQPDETTYVFHLRDDVVFQDVEPTNGRDLSAEDAAASIERFRKNALAPTRTFHTEILDSTEVVDAVTLKVTTKRPYRYSLGYLGDISAGAIIPTEFIESSASLYTQAAGTGPFQLSSADPTNRVTLTRHDKYYRSPIPYLDAMEWQVYGDNAAKLDAMREHEVDLVTAGSRQELEVLSDENSDIELTPEISLSSTALGFRIDRPPFVDPRVRQAIDLALDRETLIRNVAAGDGTILGAVNPALGEGSWSLPSSDLIAASGADEPIEERRTQARQLLAAAGASGATIELQVADVPQMKRLAEEISVLLASVGLPATLKLLDVLTWFSNFRGGNFDATLIAHLPYESPDVPLRFYHSRGPDGTASPFAFADGEMDALIERSWGEGDKAIAASTILDVQRKALDARPLLPLFTASAYSAAWKQVQNRRPGLLGSLAQYNYEQWLST